MQLYKYVARVNLCVETAPGATFFLKKEANSIREGGRPSGAMCIYIYAHAFEFKFNVDVFNCNCK